LGQGGGGAYVGREGAGEGRVSLYLRPTQPDRVCQLEKNLSWNLVRKKTGVRPRGRRGEGRRRQKPAILNESKTGNRKEKNLRRVDREIMVWEKIISETQWKRKMSEQKTRWGWSDT